VKVTLLYGYQGLRRVEIAEASAGIVAVAGIAEVNIGERGRAGEVTPEAIRIRKRILQANRRK